MRLTSVFVSVADSDALKDVAALSFNRIAVTTNVRCGMDCQGLEVARFDASGQTDRSFNASGSKGFLTYWGYEGPPQSPVFTPPVIARDGTMVAMSGGKLVRFGPDGATLSETPSVARFLPIATTPDGRIVGRIDTRSGRTTSYTIGLFGPDGTTDPSFTQVGTGTAFPTVKVARNAVWIAWASLGRPGVRPGQTVRLVRRPLDGSAGTSSRLSISSPGITRSAAFVSAIMVGSRNSATLDVDLSRRGPILVGVTPSGALNRQFGIAGLATTPPHSAAARQRDGRIVLLNSTQSDTRGQIIVRRLTRTGNVDATYPTRRITIASRYLYPQLTIDDADRAVIAANWVPVDANDGNVMLIRLLGR